MAPAFVAGRCESQRVSQREKLKYLDSQCERDPGTVRICESVPQRATKSGSQTASLGEPFLPPRENRERRQ